MTKEELIKALNVIGEDDDTENAHIDADNAIMEYINDPEIQEAYNAIDKWYA